MKRRKVHSRLYRRRVRKFGTVVINLLPFVTIAGLGAGIVVHSFGDDVLDTYNQWKMEHEIVRTHNDDELAGISDGSSNEIDSDTSVDVINDYLEDEIEEVTEEETVEEPIVEEPVIYPEVTSSELLDSGYEFLDIDFDSLKEQNADVTGWIEIPGTNVNYVVVQGDDNDYYLHHSVDGRNSSNGTIFIDSRVDLSLGDDSSSVQISPIGFYGHHMKSGKMFKVICNYKKQSYLDAHPFAVYYSPEGVYKLDFFADQYVPGDCDEGLFSNQLFDENEFDSFLTNIVNKSSISNPDVQVSYGDKIGYLVTCTYEQDNLRYAVWYKASKQYTNEIDKQNDMDNAMTLSLN